MAKAQQHEGNDDPVGSRDLGAGVLLANDKLHDEGELGMSDKKQRHGCLTAWLVLLIVVNSLVALVYILEGSSLRKHLPSAPAWTFPVLIVLLISNVIFAVALFRWKKWGFWGFVVTTIIAFFINLMIGINVVQAVLGLVGIGILYGVLQIGKENKGWPQLD